MFHLFPVRHAHHNPLRARASTRVAAFMLLAVSASIQAQSTARTARTDPWDPTAQVPALVYDSSLTASRPPSEAPPSWRQANDTVTAIGGWRAYARQAQQGPQSAAPGVSSPPTQTTLPQNAMPMHPGHGDHLSRGRPKP
ncbi:MAG: multi-Cu oxidase [Pseudomonadota bacterium]|jgi:hypothetical protein